jgi:hypothetical protein
VNARELAALMRRHVVAVMVVLVLAASVGYMLRHTQPSYEETATMILATPDSAANPNPYNVFSVSLIDTGDVMVRTLMGPQGQQQVRAAGATGTFDVALVNLYNEEYPNYQPYITVIGISQDPAEAHHTFAIVSKVLSDNLAAAQAKQGVPPVDRITGTIVGDTGPLVQSGSSKREYVIFVVLTIIAVFTVALFLDRHPFRLRRTYLTRRYLRAHNTYLK